MSRAPRKLPWPSLPAWDVRIASHTVSRWHIAETVERVYAPSAESACIDAVRRVHIREGLPPWKPNHRVSLAHATAVPVRSREAA